MTRTQRSRLLRHKCVAIITDLLRPATMPSSMAWPTRSSFTTATCSSRSPRTCTRQVYVADQHNGRAWIATIPEPATLSLLTLGILMLLRRRR